MLESSRFVSNARWKIWHFSVLINHRSRVIRILQSEQQDRASILVSQRSTVSVYIMCLNFGKAFESFLMTWWVRWGGRFALLWLN